MLLLLSPFFGLGGCASMASSAASDLAGNLTGAILGHEDPVLVAEALPAYLLLLDAMAAPPDASSGVLDAAARLYALHAGVFLPEGERALTGARRARNYGERSLCVASSEACGLDALAYPEFHARIAALPARSADALYSYALGLLVYIRADSSNWQTLTALPRVEACLLRLLEIGPASIIGNVNAHLGVLNTIRPPALGGKPEDGRVYFERAIAQTGGRDLGIKVEFARSYARLVYDRELHDRLLNEVLAAGVRQAELTLLNTLAVRQARDLLDSADDFF